MGRGKMNKATVLEMWRDEILPAVKRQYEADGIPDYPARSEAWGAFTDGLCKDGEITMRQYERWSAPRECGR